MIYAKHPEFGNGHFPDGERATLEAQGWVIWPRTKEQKAGKPVEQAAAPPEAPTVASSPPPPSPVVAAPDETNDVLIVYSRADLLAYADEKGVKVDRRWSDSRLRSELKL